MGRLLIDTHNRKMYLGLLSMPPPPQPTNQPLTRPPQATTLAEYKQFIEKDKALERRCVNALGLGVRFVDVCIRERN